MRTIGPSMQADERTGAVWVRPDLGAWPKSNVSFPAKETQP